MAGLKASVYQESTARREAEHRLAALQAEAQGAALREADLRKEAHEAQLQVRRCRGRARDWLCCVPRRAGRRCRPAGMPVCAVTSCASTPSNACCVRVCDA